MPTGYTYNVVDGQLTKFKTFALQCARAFGALIEMRDSPADAPIPDTIAPSNYHAERMAEAKKRLDYVLALSEGACDAEANNDYNKLAADMTGYAKHKDEENARLLAMRAKVQAWTPPTPEHVGLKEFMYNQLSISLNDTSPTFRQSNPKMTGAEWRVREIKRAQDDIEYHGKHHAEDIARATAKTMWLRQLRQSLED